MTTFHFDYKGHLVPYDMIETNWTSFVEAFGWSDQRRVLIELLRLFLTELNNLSIKTFTIRIDGSFATQKEQPNDLDAVFILPSITYHQFEMDLRVLRDQFDKLDVYFIRMIDETEPNYFLYVSDRAEWLFQFTMTKPDRVTRRKLPKGFIQITWNDEPAPQLT